MALSYKLLIAFLLVMPGGLLLAPAVALWLRRGRRNHNPAEAPTTAS